MISVERAQLFYAELEQTFKNPQSVFDKVVECNTLLHQIFIECTADELQLFTSRFAREQFVADSFEFSEDLRMQLRGVRRLARKKHNVQSLTEEDLVSVMYVVAIVIQSLSGIAVPTTLAAVWQATTIRFTHSAYDVKTEILPFVEAIVVDVLEQGEYQTKSYCKVKLLSSEVGEIAVTFWGELSELATKLWKGCLLHVFEVQRTASGSYATSLRSKLVIEPDILVDVTDIAECVQASTSQPLLYFLKRLTTNNVSSSLAIGSLLNFALDEYLHDSEQDFATLFTRGLKQKPLSMLACIGEEESSMQNIFNSVQTQFNVLKDIVAKMQYDTVQTEPTFVSPQYGLQGRLDMLLEYKENPQRKTVVELKSGSAPSINTAFAQSGNVLAQTGMWSNHVAQVTCYNLLLDSAFDNRSGDSQILYSQSKDFPLRNAPNLEKLKQYVLNVRNEIVVREHALLSRDFSLLKQLTPQSIVGLPSYKIESCTAFAQLYQSITPQERMYLQAFISFLLREQYSSRIGDGSSVGKGFSSLWRDSLDEKNAQLSILAYLQLDEESSNFSSMYLRFTFTRNTSHVTTFRAGDIAVLYSCTHEGHANPTKGQILKCVIQEISSHSVTISLRNKQIEQSHFMQDNLWVLEPDNNEGSMNNVYSSLVNVFSLEEQKRKILLGTESPRVQPYSYDYRSQLSEEQNIIAQSALSAQDYFIIQGPPGTGKTSVMMRTLVEELFKNPNENILLVAYTNRAVDEMCSAIKRSFSSENTLRLGNKESSEHNDILLATLAQALTYQELYYKVQTTRIVATTVSFLHANPELFAIRSFTTAIIDEASQILEPFLVGIVSRVERFILIGDEKQLPAVVTQNERGCKIQHELMSSLELYDMRTSYFERLLRLAQNHQRTHCYAMLTKQGRMHASVQEFPATAFYNGKLQTLHNWQQQEIEKSKFLIKPKHMLFVARKKEHYSKVNSHEARMVVKLCTMAYQQYGEQFNDKTIGVIVPFRAQIGEIRSQLPSYLYNNITIDTVERFQGSERDIIILATAINSPHMIESIQSNVHFGETEIDRKLNVALTRAKLQCIILGNPEVLQHSKNYAALLHYIQENDGFIE